jgi:hypothetical protein
MGAMVYPDPTWHLGSLDHLRLMQQYCDGVRRLGRSSTFQRLELTLPVGMDDGNAVIRLTVAERPLRIPSPSPHTRSSSMPRRGASA